MQEIDAAAMSLWVQYDHFDARLTAETVAAGRRLYYWRPDTSTFTPNGSLFDLQDEQLVKGGALINF